MKLAVLLAGRRPEDIVARFEQARDAGFFFCQFNLCQSGFSRADIVSIADAAVDMGVRPVAIGCHLNPLSPDEPAVMGTTRADLDLILHSLDILGARRIVFSSGTHASNLYDDHPDNANPDNLDVLRDFLTDVVDHTRARHYFLCLEPCHSHVLRHEDQIVSFHETLEPHVRERVRYVLDVPALMTAERCGLSAAAPRSPVASRPSMTAGSDEEADVEASEQADHPKITACNAAAEEVCRTLGPLAGVVHLRDVVFSDDGEASLCGPCQGLLDYPAYLRQIRQYVEPDVPAVVRNMAIPEFADVRDRLLRLSDRWELA